MKKIITYFILICTTTICWGQQTAVLSPNQYVISVGGDTINRTNHLGQREGLWSIYTEARYGDDPYYEVGKFTNNKKHGIWKKYSKSGMIIKEENYYNNYLNGESKFYDRGQLICIGTYKALRTDVEFDTILVENPKTGALMEKTVPTTLGSIKHGFWTYYKPPFNEIEKVEEYHGDELIYEKEYVTKSDSLSIQQRLDKYPHTSNRSPLNFWSRDKPKEAPRYTDFPANTDYVKPNPGKKDKH